MSVSIFATQHRLMKPRAGMKHANWNSAQSGDRHNISLRKKSAASPHLNRPYHSPKLWVVGVLIGREMLIAKWEDRP